MSISVDQLLRKIESELHKAKGAGNASSLRENVHSIKVICELILENDKGSVSNVGKVLPTAVTPVQTLSPVNLSVKKLDEEEANGESLFDF